MAAKANVRVKNGILNHLLVKNFFTCIKYSTTKIIGNAINQRALIKETIEKRTNAPRDSIKSSILVAWKTITSFTNCARRSNGTKKKSETCTNLLNIRFLP